MQEVESWLPFIKEMAPEVQILLCEKCLEQSVKGSSRMDGMCIYSCNIFTGDIIYIFVLSSAEMVRGKQV